jgi:hypothetical protein
MTARPSSPSQVQLSKGEVDRLMEWAKTFVFPERPTRKTKRSRTIG